MFTPIHLLPRYVQAEANACQERWETDEGRAIRDRILEMIRNGAGEDFLQWEFETEWLGFLETYHDLRGIDLFDEDLVSPEPRDNFEAIDFSHASFYHSTFDKFTFPMVSFAFTKLYNCTFVNCTFAYTGFYGATLDKTRFVNCDFIDRNTMTNCSLSQVEFRNWFTSEALLFDCKCDESTSIEDPRFTPNREVWKLRLEKSNLAEVFKSLKEAFRAGDASERARFYYFKQRQSFTRYNVNGLKPKVFALFVEHVTGYGVKPFWVLRTIVAVFIAFTLAFSSQAGIIDGTLLSAGAFFTFGLTTKELSTLDGRWTLLFVVESFLGIFLMALFVTVLANLWFAEK